MQSVSTLAAPVQTLSSMMRPVIRSYLMEKPSPRKKDLKVGILGALRCLDQELLKKAEHISLSTTLATNACVEGKGGRAKLVFIGVKPAFVEKMQGTYGLPPVSEIYFLPGDASETVGEEKKPDWERFRADVREMFCEFDSVAVVQMNRNTMTGNTSCWQRRLSKRN